MNRTVLQIPIDVALRKKAEEQARELGFSSLQEAIRVFLKQFAQKKLGIIFGKSEEVIQLSKRAIKRYDKMIDEIESGKVKTEAFTDVDSLMKHLNK